MSSAISAFGLACVLIVTETPPHGSVTVEPTPAAEPKPREEAEPLPDGAIARFGSKRFRGAGQVSGVALARGGSRLTVINCGGGVRIFDTATGRLLTHTLGYRVIGNPRRVYSWSPDGRYVAIATQDRQLKLLDGDTCQPVKLPDDLVARMPGVITAAFSPDSRHLVVGIRSGSSFIVQVAEGKILREMKVAGTHPRLLWFRGEDQTLMSHWEDKILREWDWRTGKLTEESDFPWRAYYPYVLDSLGDKISLIGSGVLYYRTDENGRETRMSIKTRHGSTSAGAISADRKILATAGQDRKVRLWRIADASLIGELPGLADAAGALALSEDGSLLAVGLRDRDNHVRLWRFQPAKKGLGKLTEVLASKGHRAGVKRLAFTSDGTRLCSASIDKTTKIWDVRTGGELVTIDNAYYSSISTEGAKLARYEWSPSNTVGLYDARDPEHLKRLRLVEGNSRFCVSPNGRLLATVRRRQLPGPAHIDASPERQDLATPVEETIVVTDIATGDVRHRLPLRNSECEALSWAPDSKRLAVGVANRTAYIIRIYNAQTIEQELELDGGRQYRIAFVGHKYLVTSTRIDPFYVQKPIVTWDLRSGEKVREFGSEVHVYSMVGRDNGLLITGSADGDISIWNCREGKLLKTVAGHTAGVLSLAISPDGRQFASGGQDSLIYLWDVDVLLKRG